VTDVRWLDGTSYSGQVKPLVKRWDGADEERRAQERGEDLSAESTSKSWQLRIGRPTGRGNELLHSVTRGDPYKDLVEDVGPGPVAGPVPPSSCVAAHEQRGAGGHLHIDSGEGDRVRLGGHGSLTLQSGALYEGACSERRRVVSFADGVYYGDVAQDGRSGLRSGAGAAGLVRQGQGRFTGGLAETLCDDGSVSRQRTVEGDWAADRLQDVRADATSQRRPKGRLELTDGSLYYGEFLFAGGEGSMVRHGWGRQVTADGAVLTGLWEYDRLAEREGGGEDASTSGEHGRLYDVSRWGGLLTPMALCSRD